MTPWRFHFLGMAAGWAQPLYLLLMLLTLIAGAFWVRRSLKRREALGSVVPARLMDKLAPGVSRRRPALQNLLTSLGLAFLAAALAQPQCGSKSELTKRRGIDVVVALDASKSMLARDVAPSRLERAKLELGTLLDELKGDRVALVAFAGDAFIQCPLTGDYAAAKLFLRAVDPLQMPQGGTRLSAALRLSEQLLKNADRGAKERVIVLLSDGEDLGGDVQTAAESLKEAGIQVLAVGIGSETGEPIPLINPRDGSVDYQRDAQGKTVMSRLDRASLMQLAETTGGAFFHQPRGVAMGQVLERIDSLQKSELESRLTVRYDERFQSFALPGLLLLLAAYVLRSSSLQGKTRLPVAGLLVAGMLLAWGSPAQALGLLEKEHPLVEKGRAAYAQGRYDEALAAFDQAQALLPNDPVVEFNRADALAKLKRTEEAVQAFTRVTESDRLDLRQKAHYNLGNLHAEAQRRKEALEAYRRALVLNPNDLDARHNLEVVLRKLPPPPPPSPDAGQDAGPDAGEPDAGPPEPGAPDGGAGDGGEGEPQEPEPADGGQDAGEGKESPDKPAEEGPPDAGAAPEPGKDTPDVEGEQREGDISPKEAERLLDAMKQNEKNLQLWRFQQRKPSRKTNEKDW